MVPSPKPAHIMDNIQIVSYTRPNMITWACRAISLKVKKMMYSATSQSQ